MPRAEVVPGHPDGTVVLAHLTTAHPVTDNRIFRKECIALAEAGFEVVLIAVSDADANVGGVSIVALPTRRSRLARMVLGQVSGWRALRRVRPDLLHIHDPELVPLALLWRLRHRRPIVYDAHEDLAKQVADKTYLPRGVSGAVRLLALGLQRLVDRGFSAVVAATPSIARGYRRAPVTLVQNFPWLRDFPPPTRLDPESRDVAYIGVITEGRGCREMLAAAAASTSGARLVMAGAVWPSSLLEEIEARKECVEYLGVLPADQLPSVLASSRVGLSVLHPLPNYLEAQSTKLFEYMAAGRPFVASDFPWWRHVLGDFDCGTFVDPLDVEALRAAIDELLDDPERSSEMGRRGRAALEANFTFEHEADRLVETVAALTGAAPLGSGPVAE